MRALLHRRRGSGDQFSLASFRGIVGGGRQTDRQVVKTQNWPNLGTVSFVGRWRVLQVPQVLGSCTLAMLCAVLLCVVLLLQVVLLLVLVGKSRSAGGAPHYFLPSPPST